MADSVNCLTQKHKDMCWNTQMSTAGQYGGLSLSKPSPENSENPIEEEVGRLKELECIRNTNNTQSSKTEPDQFTYELRVAMCTGLEQIYARWGLITEWRSWHKPPSLTQTLYAIINCSQMKNVFSPIESHRVYQTLLRPGDMPSIRYCTLDMWNILRILSIYFRFSSLM